MSPYARWVRLGAVGSLDLHASCAGLAATQSRAAPPIVLWGSAVADLCLGPASRPLRAAHDASEGELAWVAGLQPVYAFIVPRRLVPARVARWAAWGLTSAAATCRHVGLPVYVEAHAIWLHGRRIAACSTTAIGECAVIASSLPSNAAWPPPRELEVLFRARIEAQHGWQFEHSWPSHAERTAIHEARLALADAPGGSVGEAPGRVTAAGSQ